MAASAMRERLTTVAATVALLALAIVPGSLTGANAAHAALVPDPAAEVNPFIGTADDGNDFPGADTPFGMLQWSPDTASRPDGGGYSYDDSAITGFSLTHLGGPGCRADGDIPVLPTVGAATAATTDSFSHADEAASAGYYRVALANGITTQLTATTRTGMASFSFPAGAQAGLMLRLAGSQRQVLATSFTAVSHTEVRGSVISGNFCGAGNRYTLHFDMQFSRPFTGITSHGRVGDGPATVNLSFAAGTGRLLVKTGISYVSTANAALNLAAEDPGWSFAAIRAKATAAWNVLLDRIRIGGASASQQAVFYTALYHSLLYPSVFSDDNRQYLGVDGKVHTVDPGHSAFYTNFSGWDMYRAQAQLEALVDPAAASDAAQSMVDDYAQGGALPKWMQNNVETFFMVGDPADPVLADYYAFGARHFDVRTALADMISEATRPGPDRPGLSYLEQLGYVPVAGDYGCCNYYEPVSTTLEYNTDDFAISALAGALGQHAAQAQFQNRAQDWRNVLNPVSHLDQRREINGDWFPGFEPRSGSGFVEADSLVYTGMVPFNLAGLTRAEGGRKGMSNYLDTVLDSLTGKHGDAYLGNEPSLELPWEYDYIGQPALTQATVRQVEQSLWTDTPSGDGDGNDDLGGLSAWYVWAALGLYPMTPGTPDLALGSPEFQRAVVSLPSGRSLTLLGEGAEPGAPYVESATWQGQAWDVAHAPTRALADGGTLRFVLGTRPVTGWATQRGAAPPSYGSVPPR